MKSAHLLTMTAIAALSLTACGTAIDNADTSGSAASPGFPVTVQNCGAEVTIRDRPERILLINNDDVPILESLNALDRVVARTAPLEADVYSPDTQSALAHAPVLTSDTNNHGGSDISMETILAQSPDLVLAPENAADRRTLSEAGIALYSPPSYCSGAGSTETATFALVDDQVRTFGTILGEDELAKQRVAEYQKRLSEPAPARGTGAALYVAADGSLSAYGGPSMVTPIFAAAGLTNTFADRSERVFDVSIEELLVRNPETIVILVSEEKSDAAVANFSGVAGADALSAVKSAHVITLPFAFAGTPTPLSLDGVGKLDAALADVK